jgi:hypothetical protein
MAITNLDELVANISAVLIDGSVGAGAIGTGAIGAPKTYRRTEDGVIITQIKFDLTGLGCVGTAADDAIGLVAGGVAYIGRYVTADYGIAFKATMSCIESPAGSATITQDIDIIANASGSIEYDGALSTSRVINGATLVAGQTLENLVPAMTADDYMYIAEADTAGTTGVYSAGQYILTIYGHALLA